MILGRLDPVDVRYSQALVLTVVVDFKLPALI